MECPRRKEAAPCIAISTTTSSSFDEDLEHASCIDNRTTARHPKEAESVLSSQKQQESTKSSIPPSVRQQSFSPSIRNEQHKRLRLRPLATVTPQLLSVWLSISTFVYVASGFMYVAFFHLFFAISTWQDPTDSNTRMMMMMGIPSILALLVVETWRRYYHHDYTTSTVLSLPALFIMILYSLNYEW